MDGLLTKGACELPHRASDSRPACLIRGCVSPMHPFRWIGRSLSQGILAAYMFAGTFRQSRRQVKGGPPLGSAVGHPHRMRRSQRVHRRLIQRARAVLHARSYYYAGRSWQRTGRGGRVSSADASTVCQGWHGSMQCNTSFARDFGAVAVPSSFPTVRWKIVTAQQNAHMPRDNPCAHWDMASPAGGSSGHSAGPSLPCRTLDVPCTLPWTQAPRAVARAEHTS